MPEKKKTTERKTYRCDECGARESVCETEAMQYDLCWDCYVIHSFGICED